MMRPLTQRVEASRVADPYRAVVPVMCREVAAINHAAIEGGPNPDPNPRLDDDGTQISREGSA